MLNQLPNETPVAEYDAEPANKMQNKIGLSNKRLNNERYAEHNPEPNRPCMKGNST